MLKFLLPLLLTTMAQAAVAPADKAELGITKNYISNSGFERGSAGVKTYANTAQALPVTGSGGSPTHAAIAMTTNNPLRDRSSLVLINTGTTSALGEGFSLATFTVDNADKGKVLQASLDYAPVAGTYNPGSLTTDSDLELYVYDVTNAQVIQPAGYKFDCAVIGLPCVVRGTFQTSINGSQYRLLAHIATANTNSWQIKVDNLVVGPQVKTTGFAANDLVSAGATVITATTTAPTKGTTATDLMQYARRGDHALIKLSYNQTAVGSAAVGSGDYIFAMPPGLSFDSAKTTFNTTVAPGGTQWINAYSLGTATASYGGQNGVGKVVPYDATHFRICLNTNQGVGGGCVGSGYFAISSATINYNADFLAPIAGWSSNTVGSADAGDSREVTVIYGLATAVGASSTVPIKYDTRLRDTHGAYNPTTGLFTAPVAGTYNFAISYLGSSGGTPSLFINGVAQAAFMGGGQASGAMSAYMTAGQTASIQLDVAQTAAAKDSLGYRNILSITRTSPGNQQITATETIAASYYCTTPVSASANAPYTFETKEYDTHNAVTTTAGSWRFTAPAPGKYQVQFAHSTVAGGGNSTFGYSYKNGAKDRTIAYYVDATSGYAFGTYDVQMITGDYIDQRSSVARTIGCGASPSAANNVSYIQIKRIGN